MNEEELINYIGCKNIKARPMTKFQFSIYKNETPPFNSHNEQGYLVVYEDGYISWSPKEVFEKAYKPATGLSFGLAIEALKEGKFVTRNGWNGKDMFLWLKPATIVEESWCKDPILKEIAKTEGGSIEALGTICMYTTNAHGRKAILTGWLASQTDILSNDWIILR